MFDNDKGINDDKIISISKQIKSGAQYENPTIELKREFWNLSKDEGKNEFAKDLTVMANSQYGGGNIIVGIDGETGDLHHTTLPLDAAKLADIINRKVLEPFTVEFKELLVDGKNIIVIHIPRSYNKPHMLREYKNRQMFIPMRKGTRTVSADRYDLDLMYTEREKIVIPPYRLEPLIGQDELQINPSFSRGLYSLNCLINIHNSGSRTNVVLGGNITIYKEDTEMYSLDLTSYYIPMRSVDWESMNNNNFLKVSQDDVMFVNLGFKVEDKEQYSHFNANMDNYLVQITLKDIKGNVFFTDVVKARNGN
ncbi:AlbA family DNA-binding domain-containing protein [Lysinibacillus capsici]|uniref:AlbA family DNA-binding domain-containing protein n=1 Tax=Lysinibacillus capsici TaxID=2115968 RepID=UPI002480C41C|nr:ATP-binding protein [Lysinibacillus capsici]